jgi:hypothetical protein
VQPTVDQAQYFVAPGGGLDPEPAGGDEVAQRFGVPGESEEPVLLGDQLWLGAVVGAAAVGEVVRLVELLATYAVQAFVVLAVEIARLGWSPRRRRCRASTSAWTSSRANPRCGRAFTNGMVVVR